jgi:uncharacterized protein YcbK (DUF882 family)
MGTLSKNFDRSEFECGCGCGYNTVDHELVVILEKLREHWGQPITVTSGARCEQHNANEGGGLNSQHLLGRAADIQVKDKTPHQVYVLLNEWYPYHYGMGSYDSFTHIDTRSNRARWKG